MANGVIASFVAPTRGGEATVRRFRRVVYTGTMDARRQLIRPAHEVAIGIWLATLVAR